VVDGVGVVEGEVVIVLAAEALKGVKTPRLEPRV
jgi:hypothetical protein